MSKLPKKNDISDLKGNFTTILPSKTGKAGRPKKDKALLESEVVSLKITQAEYAVLSRKAGLVPVATYIKHLIRTQTNWLENKDD